jgi:hypothetical protein
LPPLRAVLGPDGPEQLTIRAQPRLDEHQLDGWLMRDGQVVEPNGGLEESAVIAAWMRTIVPDDQELIFWDEGYHFDVQLVPGIPADDIVAAVEAAQDVRRSS